LRNSIVGDGFAANGDVREGSDLLPAEAGSYRL